MVQYLIKPFAAPTKLRKSHQTLFDFIHFLKVAEKVYKLSVHNSLVFKILSSVAPTAAVYVQSQNFIVQKKIKSFQQVLRWLHNSLD